MAELIAYYSRRGENYFNQDTLGGYCNENR